MRVNPKDGTCRECGGPLTIIAADDATMTVECDECGDLYDVEPDAFGDGCMTYYASFLAGFDHPQHKEPASTTPSTRRRRMDPQATLTDLLQAVADRDWDRSDELAEALLNWIGNGGFPPRTIGPETMTRHWDRAVTEFLCYLAQAQAMTARKRQRRRKGTA